MHQPYRYRRRGRTRVRPARLGYTRAVHREPPTIPHAHVQDLQTRRAASRPAITVPVLWADASGGLPDSSRLALTIALGANALVIAASVLLAVMVGAKPTRFFDEGQPVTLFSAAQVLLAAGLCVIVFRIRWRAAPDRPARRAAMLWILAASAGAYLAADELLEFHESLDHAIHAALAVHQTVLSDRLDDAVMLLYGLLGLAALYVFRRELAALRPVWPLFKLGVALFFVSVIADALTDSWSVRPVVLQAAQHPTGHITPLRMLGHAAHVLEDALKLATECVVIATLIGLAWPKLTEHEIAERN
jgi:hypothetical protein